MTRSARSIPPVEVEAEGEAAGMAAMVGDLIEANLDGSRARAWVARRVHGRVLLEASDRDLGVTVCFDGQRISVLARREPGILPAMRGPWLAMTRVCSGLVSPLQALRREDVKLGLSTPLTALVATALVMKVPRGVYRDSTVNEQPASI